MEKLVDTVTLKIEELGAKRRALEDVEQRIEELETRLSGSQRQIESTQKSKPACLTPSINTESSSPFTGR